MGAHFLSAGFVEPVVESLQGGDVRFDGWCIGIFD